MDFKKLVGDWFGFSSEILDLTLKVNAQNLSLAEYDKQLSEARTLLATTQTEDKKIITELQAKLEPDPNEVFWDNRYPKQTITYFREETDGEYQTDVRDYFQEFDSTIPTVAGVSNDAKALAALIYVIKNVVYTSDKPNYGWDEYWAYSYQTLKRRKGDCEDGAILLANIMLRSGVPFWRIRLNAGSVTGGGHAYVTYCRETDNQFVVLDWCYWPNTLPVAQRKLHKDEQNYADPAHNYGVWFSWNQKYCFGKMETMAGMPDELVVK